MDILNIDTPIIAKTKELCETIIQQPEFSELQTHVDAFSNDPGAQQLFQQVQHQQDQLMAKQSRGEQLSEEEIQQFENDRDALINNSVARDFLEAQQQMQQVRQTVTQYVNRTFELGRVPSESDFGGCDGCSCGG